MVVVEFVNYNINVMLIEIEFLGLVEGLIKVDC